MVKQAAVPDLIRSIQSIYLILSTRIHSHTHTHIYNIIIYIYLCTVYVAKIYVLLCPALAGSSMSFIGFRRLLQGMFQIREPKARRQMDTDCGLLEDKLLPSIDIYRMFIPQTVWPHLGFLPQ